LPACIPSGSIELPELEKSAAATLALYIKLVAVTERWVDDLDNLSPAAGLKAFSLLAPALESIAIAALRAAIDQIDIEIARASEKARLDADRKLREQTSRDLHARADRGQKIIKPLMDALAAVHTWLQDDAEATLPQSTG
jgi:hypothetical protein